MYPFCAQEFFRVTLSTGNNFLDFSSILFLWVVCFSSIFDLGLFGFLEFLFWFVIFDNFWTGFVWFSQILIWVCCFSQDFDMGLFGFLSYLIWVLSGFLNASFVVVYCLFLKIWFGFVCFYQNFGWVCCFFLKIRFGYVCFSQILIFFYTRN